jgi:hypothetical protein
MGGSFFHHSTGVSGYENPLPFHYSHLVSV